MKTWQLLALGVMFGLTFAALILLVSKTPQGTPIKLIPLKEKDTIIIEISGAVENPGVYSLPMKSRVSEGITKAGGLKSNASTTTLNLASILQDGQKITVPYISEGNSVNIQSNQVASTIQGGNISHQKTININIASQSELETLPGIGSQKAEAIIEYREKNGPFRSLTDVQNVSGIGSGIFEKIKDLITIQ